MNFMRLVRAGAVLITVAALHAAIPPTPRPAPDFVVRLTDGNEFPLKSLRGKVVALTFVHTTCPHCQRATQLFTRLYQEYGARGFEPVGVAFNPMANLYVDEFVKNTGARHPVGFSPLEPVLGFLGISPMERYVVPQIVWIDRKGIIRSQTPPLGEDKLLNEHYWREMIETLLKEGAETTKKAPAVHTTQAKTTPSR
jgi:peroxiredoxin